MFKKNTNIYLASKSPRRRKLLKQIGLNFKSFSVDLDEEVLDGEHPIRTVKRLSQEKMTLASAKVKEGIIITADTIVVLDKHIIGKPKNKKDAVKILNLLSDKKHYVYTGFSIMDKKSNIVITDYEKTAVIFNKLTTAQIKNYVNDGSPMDKAGAYGIQDDYGSVFVKRINGCYYNVVGLPVAKLYQNLIRFL
jgi:septum formation protein